MKENFLDVVVVTYKCPEDVQALKRDLPAMAGMPYALFMKDNSDNADTLTRLWNRMARQGEGEYIAFLNTDIRLSPKWDWHLAEVLRTHPEIGVVMANPIGHDWPHLADPAKEAFPLSNRNIPAPPPEAMIAIAARLESDGMIHGCGNCRAPFFAVMTKRSIFEALKGFDERLRFYGQDHDFQRRMLKRMKLLTAKVASSAVWHRCAGSVREGAGHVDLNGEMLHCARITEALINETMKEWDLLEESERRSVGEDPRYSKMPLFK